MQGHKLRDVFCVLQLFQSNNTAVVSMFSLIRRVATGYIRWSCANDTTTFTILSQLRTTSDRFLTLIVDAVDAMHADSGNTGGGAHGHAEGCPEGTRAGPSGCPSPAT